MLENSIRLSFPFDMPAAEGSKRSFENDCVHKICRHARLVCSKAKVKSSF
jgi:hypothetical protein